MVLLFLVTCIPLPFALAKSEPAWELHVGVDDAGVPTKNAGTSESYFAPFFNILGPVFCTCLDQGNLFDVLITTFSFRHRNC